MRTREFRRRRIVEHFVVAAALKSGKPAVIDAVIDGNAEVLAEPFRRDALKKPIRFLEKYRHLIVE